MSQKTLRSLEIIAKGDGELAHAAREKLTEEMAKIQEVAEAENERLKVAEKQLEQQVAATGLTREQVQKADITNKAILEMEATVKKQEEVFKELGIEAKDNAVYRANMMEIEKTKLAQAKATGSKQAEEDAKKNIRDLRQETFL